jgi:hypothetical protein
MFYLVQDDVGTQVKATLTREDDGLAADLSGATVVLKFRAKGTNTILSTIGCISSGTQLEDGEAVFQFTNGQLSVEEGKYEGEIEATFTDGRIESVFEKLDFYVRQDF